jgi:hypothetical protein
MVPECTAKYSAYLARPCNMCRFQTWRSRHTPGLPRVNWWLYRLMWDIVLAPSHTTIRTSLPSHVTFQAQKTRSGQVEIFVRSDPADASVFRWMMEKTWGDFTVGQNIVLFTLHEQKQIYMILSRVPSRIQSTSFQVRICCNNHIKWYLQNDEQLTTQTWGRNHVYHTVHHQRIWIAAGNRKTPAN